MPIYEVVFRGRQKVTVEAESKEVAKIVASFKRIEDKHKQNKDASLSDFDVIYAIEIKQ